MAASFMDVTRLPAALHPQARKGKERRSGAGGSGSDPRKRPPWTSPSRTFPPTSTSSTRLLRTSRPSWTWLLCRAGCERCPSKGHRMKGSAKPGAGRTGNETPTGTGLDRSGRVRAQWAIGHDLRGIVGLGARISVEVGLAAMGAGFRLKLERLTLLDCGVDDAALAALMAGVANLPALRELTLSEGKITDVGVVALASSELLSKLDELWLNNSLVTDAGVVALARSPRIANLKQLNLARSSWFQGASLGPAAAEALATSPHLEDIKLLNLHGPRPAGRVGLLAAAGAIWCGSHVACDRAAVMSRQPPSCEFRG